MLPSSIKHVACTTSQVGVDHSHSTVGWLCLIWKCSQIEWGKSLFTSLMRVYKFNCKFSRYTVVKQTNKTWWNNDEIEISQSRCQKILEHQTNTPRCQTMYQTIFKLIGVKSQQNHLRFNNSFHWIEDPVNPWRRKLFMTFTWKSLFSNVRWEDSFAKWLIFALK